MVKKILFVVVIVAVVSIFPGSSHASDDTYVKIQEMVNDLGPVPERNNNNGQVQRCADDGTKKITIKESKGRTSYQGVYNKCREYGRYRDGNTTITVGR